MDSRAQGEELSQLSRLLYDSAANKWYAAIGLEVAAGVMAAALGILEPPGDWALAGAFFGVGLIAVSYGLRLWFDAQYDAAETMRRQAVLTEGLDWPLDKLQTIEWLQKAGQRIRKRLKVQPRDPDYYATREPAGSARLAQMTVESAFYTRHLYEKLRFWMWVLFAGAALLSLLAILVALTRTIPDQIDVLVARTLYAIIPVVLSVNLLGWARRLGRSIAAIREVEADLERLQQDASLTEPRVMRLLSEYNCQVVGGFPIHAALFRRWRGEIRELWERRAKI